MESLAHLVGKELFGYRLTQLLGEGGMAAVFRGENLLDPSILRAIKVVKPQLVADAEFTRRFAEEARVLERLQHPNVVRFFGARWESGFLIMELELLRGAALSHHVRRAASGGPLPVAQVLGWFRQAADGLAAAHAQGFVHRDIKPDNLFVSDEGQVKILDFGIARALDEAERATTVTRAGTVPGTPAYLAPEVCRRGQPSMGSDVYAMGLTLLEVLLGFHPLQPPERARRSALELMFAQVQEPLPDLRQHRADIPEGLAEVVRRATAKDPKARYAQASELREALYALESDGESKIAVRDPVAGSPPVVTGQAPAAPIGVSADSTGSSDSPLSSPSGGSSDSLASSGKEPSPRSRPSEPSHETRETAASEPPTGHVATPMAPGPTLAPIEARPQASPTPQAEAEVLRLPMDTPGPTPLTGPAPRAVQPRSRALWLGLGIGIAVAASALGLGIQALRDPPPLAGDPALPRLAPPSPAPTAPAGRLPEALVPAAPDQGADAPSGTPDQALASTVDAARPDRARGRGRSPTHPPQGPRPPTAQPPPPTAPGSASAAIQVKCTGMDLDNVYQDPSVIRRLVEKHHPAILRCYQQAATGSDDLSYLFYLVTLTRDGLVKEVGYPGKRAPPGLHACMERAFKDLPWPPPDNRQGGTIRLSMSAHRPAKRIVDLP